MAAEKGDSFCLLLLQGGHIKRADIKEEDLRRLYVSDMLSQRDIAKKYHVGQTTIRRYMKKYGITARSSLDARSTPTSREKYAVFGKRYSVEYTKQRQNVCKFCGRPFTVNSATKNKKFCSKECLAEHYKTIKKNRPKQICAYCGSEITTGISDPAYKRKYCKQCVENRVWSRRDNRIDTECAYCHKPMKVIKSRYIANQNCYCSVQCMSDGYRGKFSGEQSPTWKGGKSHHYTGNFFRMRKLARQRDGYICQRCGISESEYGKELSVHHIRNYREFDCKEDANHLDNLISLCEPCHRFIHSNANKNKEYIL